MAGDPESGQFDRGRSLARQAAGLAGSDGASLEAIRALEDSLAVRLPAEYRGFVSEVDGAEGYVGQDYFAAWPVAEVADVNRQMQVDRYLPGLTLFASDGIGNAYGFDRRSGSHPAIVLVPLIGMDWEYATPVASDFVEFFTAREAVPRPAAPPADPRRPRRLRGASRHPRRRPG